jgi:tetratricopeptide (TPR) repeat protein
VNENPQLLPPETRTALQNCFAQIRLARATELAQSGRFLEAEAVLVGNGDLQETPRALDLLARIAAQQRQYQRAEELWRKALSRAPETKEFREGLTALQKLRDRKQLQRDLIPGILFFLLISGVTALAVLFFSAFR